VIELRKTGKLRCYAHSAIAQHVSALIIDSVIISPCKASSFSYVAPANILVTTPDGLQAYSISLDEKRLYDDEINHAKAILEDAEKRIKRT
jgi:hypothetical protein